RHGSPLGPPPRRLVLAVLSPPFLPLPLHPVCRLYSAPSSPAFTTTPARCAFTCSLRRYCACSPFPLAPRRRRNLRLPPPLRHRRQQSLLPSKEGRHLP